MSKSLTYSAGSTDCYAGFSSGLVTGSTALFVAGTSGLDDDVRTWMPFTVLLPRNLVIISATLRVVAETSRSETPIPVYVCCEAADNPSAPANGAAMFAKSLTTAKLSTNLAAYTAGTEYSYDITTSVQEILNRSGWASGNTMAVMFVDNGTSGSDRRTIAASEHATYTEPQLDIVFPDYFPRGSAMI